MPRHHAVAATVALGSQFLEELGGVAAFLAPAPLQIFLKALYFGGTRPGRLAFGKDAGSNPAPHRSTVQMKDRADLLLRVALAISFNHFFITLEAALTTSCCKICWRVFDSCGPRCHSVRSGTPSLSHNS